MKAPKIPDIDDTLVDNVVRRWREGELVAIPTETVYGLAADATNGEAVARIYTLKSRPQFNPLIVHVASASIAQRYVAWNTRAELLAKAFWPGPLTLILPRARDGAISPLVSAGGETLALRVPAHPIALKLLRAFDGGIAAPSANRSGRVSPTTTAHVRDEFGTDAPLIVEGGACRVGVESTIVDISGEAARILRPGGITPEMLQAVLGETCTYAIADSTETQTLLSPGLLASHYAPSIPVRLNATAVTADEALLAFGSTPLVGAATTLNLSATGDLIEAASRLFASLRALDRDAYRAIAVMPIPAEGIGLAINDRLQRAAAR